MKTKKLFWKLFPTYFIISLLGLTILLTIVRFAIENFYFEQTSSNLEEKAYILSDSFQDDLQSNQLAKISSKIKYFSLRSKNRITIIASTGVVIADSDFNSEQMENHRDREEVLTALTGKVGKSIRYSKTLDEAHLYLAVPLYHNKNIIGVLRNSVSVGKLQTALFILTKRVVIWSFLLMLLLLWLIYIQTKKITYPLEEIKKQVEKYSTGNFQNKIRINQIDTEEIFSLSNTIDQMGQKLQNQFQEIVKQKNAQEAVFTSMIEGVVSLDLELNIRHINKTARELLGINDNHVVKGMSLKKLSLNEKLNNLAMLPLGDSCIHIDEIEFENETVIKARSTVLKNHEGEIIGALVVFNDITKLRTLENYRKEFAANVSHELKTPLTAIQGFLETIMEGDVEDKATLNKFLNIINKHTQRLRLIVDDILTLSTIEKESDFGEIELAFVNIKPILDSARFLCQKKYEHKNIDVNVHGDASIKANVNIFLLEQAIVNLLDNAIKYSPEFSVVNLKLENINDNLAISVIDQGQGISTKFHKRLFERFYSVDKARSRKLGGSGLGLSIVKHIAIAHKGSVTVSSVVPYGSTFTIFIPHS